MRAVRPILAAVVAGALVGCSSFSAPGWMWPFGSGDGSRQDAPQRVGPASPASPPATSDEAVLGFHERAQAFYERLAQRRFNTLATYNDPALHGYFETLDAYSDYYAQLAEALAAAHFEKNRPLAAELQEFAMESSGRARVRFRLVGRSSQPLRFWRVSIERDDIWEQRGDRWWIVPGKL